MIDFRDELSAFLKTHPCQEAAVGEARFRYILSGGGDRPAIVFLNGLNMQEEWLRYVEAFEKDYRVLVIEYPNCYHANLALLDGIAGLLGKLGIEKPIIVGGSDGGMLAQLYVRRFPQNISALVLMSTVTLDSEYVAGIRRDLPMMQVMLKTFGLMPFGLMKNKLLSEVYGYFNGETEDEQAYGRSFFETIASDAGCKQKFLGAYELVADMAKQEPFRPEEFAGLGDRILILHPENDIFSGEDQQKLDALLPAAEVRRMAGGHIAFVMRAGEYIDAIKAFLNRVQL